VFVQTIIRLLMCVVLTSVITACSTDPEPSPTTGTIVGVVYDGAATTPLPQVLVTTMPPTSSILSDAEGKFRIESVTAGAYIVQATKPGIGSGSTAISVVAGKDVNADLFLLRVPSGKGIITGKISDESGGKVAGAVITTTPPSNAAASDAEGRYVLDGIPVGNYVVKAAKTGVGVGYAGAIVVSDLGVEANVLLLEQDPLKGRIVGTVTNRELSTPLSGAVVTVRSTSISATTDASGNFTLNNVPTGQVTVDASHALYPTRAMNAVSTANEVTILNITLSSTPAIPAITNGLYIYYPCDGDGYDAGPNGMHATAKDVVSATDRNGTAGGALKMNGSSSMLECAHTDRLNETPMTIAFWYKHTGPDIDDALVLGKYIHPSGAGWLFLLENEEMVACFFNGNFTGPRIDGPKYNSNVDQWTHIAFVVGSTSSKLYINGTMVGSTSGRPDGFGASITEPMKIGILRSTTITPVGMKGDMDDVYIFTRALDASEIMTLVNQ